MPKYEQGPRRSHDREGGEPDLGARERLRRFLDTTEHADEADEPARGLDDDDSPDGLERDAVADLTGPLRGGADTSSPAGEPPLWPEKWEQPGRVREEPPQQAQTAAEPPPWPEEWSAKAGVRAVRPTPAGPAPESPAPVEPVESWAPEHAPHLAPGYQPAAQEDTSQDPPAWPDEWDVAAKRALGARARKAREAAEASDRQDTETSKPPRADLPPAVAETWDDGASASDAPPPWPEEWSTQAGVRAVRKAPDPEADRPAIPAAQPDQEAPAAQPDQEAPATQDPPEWPEDWRGRGPGTSEMAPMPVPASQPLQPIAPPASSVEPTYWRVLRSVADPILTSLGFRRLRELPGPGLVPAALRRKPDDDPEAVRRVASYLALGLLLAAVALAAVWVYATFTPTQTLSQAESARALMRQTVAHIAAGEYKDAKRLRDELATQAGDSLVLSFFDGYLMAAEDGPGSPRIRELARRSWIRRRSLRNLVTLAGYYEGTDQIQKAIEALDAANKIDPQNIETRLLLANLSVMTGRFEEALTLADELDRIAGPSLPTIQVRGQAYIGLGKGREAASEFRAALLYDDNIAASHLGLADAYALLGEYDKAREELRTVLRRHGDDAEAYARLGVIAEHEGDYEDAQRQYKAALAAAPKHAGALNNLAFLLADVEGRPEEALAYANRAYELSPNSPAVLDTIGWVKYLTGDYKAAEELLVRANGLDQNSPELRYHLALTYLKMGKREPGVQLLTVVADRDTDPKFRKLARKELTRLGVISDPLAVRPTQ